MRRGADVIDSVRHPAIRTPRPFCPDIECAYRVPVLDVTKADGIPVSLDSYQPATQAYALSRWWPISMIFAVFQTLRSIRNWRNHLPNRRYAFEKTGRQIIHAPAGDIIITLWRSLTRASRRGTGAGRSNANCLVL